VPVALVGVQANEASERMRGSENLERTRVMVG